MGACLCGTDRKRNSRLTFKIGSQAPQTQRGQDTSPLSVQWRLEEKKIGGYQTHLDPIWRLERAQQTTIFRLCTGHYGLIAHVKRTGIPDTSLVREDTLTKPQITSFRTAGFVAPTRLKILPARLSVAKEEEVLLRFVLIYFVMFYFVCLFITFFLSFFLSSFLFFSFFFFFVVVVCFIVCCWTFCKGRYVSYRLLLTVSGIVSLCLSSSLSLIGFANDVTCITYIVTCITSKSHILDRWHCLISVEYIPRWFLRTVG